MEKVRLGKTGLVVSRIGFGGIPIQRVSEEEAVAVVRRCLDLGINFFDTATMYTTSEERIGKAIAGRREGLVLATKTISRSRDGVGRHLKLSLERLNVEHIDLYQFHQVGTFDALEKVLDPRGPMGLLEDAKRSGTIRHIGFSSHSLDVAREAVKTGRFETVMFPFNFVAREAADELLPLTREHDVGFIAMKPLEGGMLDSVGIAFKYLMQFRDVVPIPGIEKVHEIEEIAQILEGPLEMSETEMLEMQALRDELGTRFCRRCDYCQPCPQGIPISMVMQGRSVLKRMRPEWFFGSWFADALEKAADCTECGECEERCPYNLPIREMIADLGEWFQEEKQRYRGDAS